MATFYVVPSRQLLGQHFAQLLAALFPGVSYTLWDWPDLAEAVAALVEGQETGFVVYREELDEQLSTRDALVQHFGADAGDEIIEVSFGKSAHPRWAHAEDVRQTA
jgi:hypothetical protein